MAVHSEVDEKQNLIIHHFNDSVSLQTLIQTIETTLSDPKYKPGMNAIWVCEDGTKIDINSEEARKLGDISRKAFDQSGISYKLAMVASEDLAYGMQRVYEGWCNDRPVSIRTFRQFDDAYDWITS